MKAASWLPICCIAIADVIASSMPQPCGSCWFWLPRSLTWWLLDCPQPQRLPLQRKTSSLFLKSHLVFSSPIDAEELQSLLKIQTGLFVCPCVFMHKFFAAFVIMSHVFLLFVVLSCACDYLYYKHDPRCCERYVITNNFITHLVAWLLWITHALCLSSHGFPSNKT